MIELLLPFIATAALAQDFKESWKLAEADKKKPHAAEYSKQFSAALKDHLKKARVDCIKKKGTIKVVLKIADAGNLEEVIADAKPEENTCMQKIVGFTGAKPPTAPFMIGVSVK